MFAAPIAVRRIRNRRTEDDVDREEQGQAREASRTRKASRAGFLYGEGSDYHVAGRDDAEEEQQEEEEEARQQRGGWTYNCGNLVRSKAEEAARRKEAQQRWKILCLIRTFHGADGVDEQTRQERLRNRVDDWMSSFVSRLRISGSGGDANVDSNNHLATSPAAAERKSRDSGLESAELDTTSSSLLLTKSAPTPLPPIAAAGSELRQSRAMARRAFEGEQRRRMEARAAGERERIRRERVRRRLGNSPQMAVRAEEEAELLVAASPVVRSTLLQATDRRPRQSRSLSPLQPRTTGKSKRKKSPPKSANKKKESTSKRTEKISVKMKKIRKKKEPRQDLLLPPVITNGNPAPEHQGGKPRRARGRRRRRRSGSDRERASSSSLELPGGDGDLHSMLEDATETVVANLLYDERADDFVDGVPELPDDDDDDGGDGVGRRRRGNPVFHAFEKAKGVDDLYRIAEIWVNPTYYGLDPES